MSVTALLSEARRLGARLEANGGRLIVEAPAPLPGELVAQLRAHRDELLALVSANQTSAERENIIECWTERAAIMEYCGGLSRKGSDREAWARTLAYFGLPASYRLH